MQWSGSGRGSADVASIGTRISGPRTWVHDVVLQRSSTSESNALANQNAALDRARAQTRFVRMLEHEFESRFEICVLIGQPITSAF